MEPVLFSVLPSCYKDVVITSLLGSEILTSCSVDSCLILWEKSCMWSKRVLTSPGSVSEWGGHMNMLVTSVSLQSLLSFVSLVALIRTSNLLPLWLPQQFSWGKLLTTVAAPGNPFAVLGWWYFLVAIHPYPVASIAAQSLWQKQ